MIIKDLKEKQISISKSTISDIKNEKENPKEINKKMFKKGNRRSLTEIQIKGLKIMAENPNPPTRKAMANKLKTTRSVVIYGINHILKKKLVKNRKAII